VKTVSSMPESCTAMPRAKLIDTLSLGFRYQKNCCRPGLLLRRARSRPTSVRVLSSMDSARVRPKVLVADIGGTNARFSVWSACGSEEICNWSCQTSVHASFESCLEQLLSETQIDEFDAACFAVAGVVSNDSCTLTNIGWTVDAKTIKSSFNIRKVKVINDFEAVGYGIFELKPEDIMELHQGEPASTGPIAVLGPGTGLGEAILLWDPHSDQYAVHATEGSHADFAARGTLQHELALWLEEQLQECEVEHLCSGPGLVRIYDFLRRQKTSGLPILTPAEVSEKAAIGSCEVCAQAVNVFLEILGAEAANLSLKCLASGGVYIAGGIPPKMGDMLSNGHLLNSFLRPGCKMHGLRKSFPLRVVLNPEVGLLGSKSVALKMLSS